MKFRKIKNGLVITVADWDNKIVITNADTKEIVKTQEFSDHVVAITLAKLL